MARHLFTSESVTEGHPDKICDQISDAILDEILTHDPDARVACETCASTGLVHIMGEITTSCYVDFQKIVREVISDIGYTRAKYGFDADTCAVISNIDGQSPDIAPVSYTHLDVYKRQVLSYYFLVFSASTLIMALLATSLYFGLMAVYGTTTHKDLTGWGPVSYTHLDVYKRQG